MFGCGRRACWECASSHFPSLQHRTRKNLFPRWPTSDVGRRSPHHSTTNDLFFPRCLSSGVDRRLPSEAKSRRQHPTTKEFSAL